jgi:hypothetical protein
MNATLATCCRLSAIFNQSERYTINQKKCSPSGYWTPFQSPMKSPAGGLRTHR